MNSPVHHIPAGYKSMTPYLVMNNAKKAIEFYKTVFDAKAILERPVENQFYGDRSGSIKDPYGHKWTIATHIEDVTPEEMKKRAAALFGG